MYTAYVLNEASRDLLKKRFPPKYSTFIGHHVTHEFGVDDEVLSWMEPMPKGQIKVVGYVDDGEGLEALVVSVNGSTERPDGKTYHITWSLNEGRKPVESNDLLTNKQYTLTMPIAIEARPELLK